MGTRVDYVVSAGDEKLFVSLDAGTIRKPGESISLRIMDKGAWFIKD